MACHDITYRVPYADTDQMGVVYYANYLTYFERSRTEMLRDAGLPYSELEQQGFFLPVAEANCKYLVPARYDQLLTLQSWIEEIRGVRMVIGTKVLHAGITLAKGSVTLACIGANRKPVRVPDFLIAACLPFATTTISPS